MQRALDYFTAEQIREDPHAAEIHCRPQEKYLEDAGQDLGISRETMIRNVAAPHRDDRVQPDDCRRRKGE